MHDPRMQKLATLLVHYSIRIQRGEKMAIEAIAVPLEMVELLVETVAAAGGLPFVEKIAGSIHLTPGQAYQEADNGNRSKVHWDLVQIQTPEMGGGEVWFDAELIRKDGRFLPSDLQGLNPEALL